MTSTPVERERDPFRATRRSLRVRWRILPWWAKVTIVYAAARAVTTVFVMALANVQAANSWTSAKPTLLEYSNLWDALWYEIIGVQAIPAPAGSATEMPAWMPLLGLAGYPDELPRDATGHVQQNTWAFMPVYPIIVRAMTFTGLTWDAAAVLVSLTAGLGAALVFHRLMSRFLEPDRALFAVVLFCVAPVSPIMQFGYAESLGFLLLALALLLLVDRRYGWLFPVIAVWSFTRPGALAFALALALHWAWRWFRRGREPFPVRDRVLAASVALFSGLAGFAWIGVAWAATGDPQAYTDTELAWRSVYIGYRELVPFTPWFQAGDWWLGQPLGTVAVIALILAFALFLASPAVGRLGVDIRFWSLSYALYLFAVFFPQSSIFRILAPLFPLLGAIALPRQRWYRWGLVVLFLALQVGWLMICWRVDGYDWTPP